MIDLNAEQVNKTLVNYEDKLFYACGDSTYKISMIPGRYKMLHQELGDDYRVSITIIRQE